MIAIPNSQCQSSHTCRQNSCASKFEELLPAIQSQARVAFRGLPASEKEELIAETIANAFCAYRRLVERGRAELAYATPLAQYAVLQVRAGRRVGGKLNVKDVTSIHCRNRKGVNVESLTRYNQRKDQWQEVLVEDKSAGPAEIAATRIDFGDWLGTLSGKQRRIAKTLATGESTSRAARKHRVTPGRISQLRRELMEAWEQFHGGDGDSGGSCGLPKADRRGLTLVALGRHGSLLK